MKVISLLQPWASLVVLGHKQIETRSWDTKHRGPLLIHASAKKFRGDQLPVGLLKNINDVGLWGYEYPYGAIIGQVNLDGTLPSECFFLPSQHKPFGCEISEQEMQFGDYSPNRFGWLLSDPIKFDEPIPIAGALSLWEFDLNTKQKVTKAKKPTPSLF